MNFFNAVSIIISVVGQFSPAFALFYLIMVIKDKMRKPRSPYKITPEEHEQWCKNRIIIHSLLCVLYALIFVLSLLQMIAGVWICLIALLVVYVFRTKNNLKYVK